MSDIKLRKVGKMFTESGDDDKYTFVVTEGSGSTTDRDELVAALDITNSDFSINTYERHAQIPALPRGTPAQQPTQVAVDTLAGLQFANGSTKYAYAEWVVPEDWDGTDIYIEVDWFPNSGALNGTTDTVIWDIDFRSISEGEATNNGTIESLQSTYTASLAQYVTHHSRHTIDADGANQPVTAGDHIYFRISRNSGDVFAGTVVVTAFEIVYNSNDIPTN